MNVESLCTYMRVSRSGYYKWVKRKGILNRYQTNRLWLIEEIKETYVKHKIWGYKHRAAYIRNKTNRYFSDLLCHKCCKLLGIRSKARIKRHKAGKEHEIYPNLLHDFDVSRPFEKVCTDTTILTHKSGKYDWNLYIDLFDNTIIAYDIRRSNYGLSPINHYNAAKNFIDEKEKRGYMNLDTIVHSDQGAIYTSRGFNSLFNHTIKRSMSRIATPTDNPIVESLNGWIKDELKYDYDFYHSDKPLEIIKKYVAYFNNERLAYSLKYKTPIQYRTELGFR